MPLFLASRKTGPVVCSYCPRRLDRWRVCWYRYCWSEHDFNLNDFRGTISHNDIVKLYQNIIASINYMPSVSRGLVTSTSPFPWWLHLCPLLTETGLNRRWIELTQLTGSAGRKHKTNYESLNCWKTWLSRQEGNFWKTAIWNSWISTFSLHEEVALWW